MYVTPFLVGGFGNRVFQLLACLKISEETGRETVFDLGAIAHNPHESYHETLQQLRELFPSIRTGTAVWTNVYETKAFQYDPDLFQKHAASVPLKLTGYYQSIDWAPTKLPSIVKERIANTVFFHIRLGDYVGGGFDVGLPKRYFPAAVQYILGQKSGPVEFLVFSDEPEKAEAIVKALPVSISYRISQAKRALDVLREMASCSGGICSNSSLSLLGALFQGDHRGPVTIPRIWGRSATHEAEGPTAPWANRMEC
jgi:hypothetical protein